jgi:hypothetical protein
MMHGNKEIFLCRPDCALCVRQRIYSELSRNHQFVYEQTEKIVLLLGFVAQEGENERQRLCPDIQQGVKR